MNLKGFTIQDQIKSWKSPMYNSEDLSEVASDQLDINSTINPVDREDATLEAEKDEILLNPDGKVFKILGKSHSKGGTPLNVPEGSFIYSKFKPLAIDKEAKKLFEFKEGGKYTKSKNTPAKILQREIDIKHHNKMIALTDSVEHDNISKTSASLMLEKNFKKLGQVAYLQEEKKGFPNGLPTFAEGTAPNQNPEMEQQFIQSKQFQSGGFIPLFAEGGHTIKRNNRTYTLVNQSDVNPKWKLEGTEGNQHFYIDPATGQMVYTQRPVSGRSNLTVDKMVNDPNTFKSFHRLMQGAPKPVMEEAANNIIQNGKWPSQYQAGNDNRFYTDRPLPAMVNPNSGVPNPTGEAPKVTNPTAPKPWEYSGPILPFEPSLNKTFNMKQDEAFAAWNAVNTPNFYPVRNQYNFTPLVSEKLSDRPILNQLGQQTSSFLQNNRLTSPLLSRANNAFAKGQFDAQANQAVGSIANQNVQIGNAQNQYNNQGQNRVAEMNVNANSDYVDKVNMTDQNSNIERKLGWNQFQSLRNRNSDIISKTEMMLASQPTYGTVWADKNGNELSPEQTANVSEEQLARQGFVKKAAPLFNLNKNSWKPYYTGAGSLDLMSTQSNGRFKSNSELLNEMDELGITNSADRARYAAYIRKAELNPKFQQLQTPYYPQ